MWRYRERPEDLEVGLGGYDASLAHGFGVCLHTTGGGSSPAAKEDASDDLEAVTNGEHSGSEDSTPDLEAGLVSNDSPTSFVLLILGILSKAFMMSRRSRAHDPETEQPNASANPNAGGFDIVLDELAKLVRDRDLEALNQYNGVEGLSILLKTDLENGIDRRDEILHRRKTFGSNKFPCDKGKSFWRFIWKATQFPPSLVITLAVVIQSLLRIKQKAIHNGWYEEAGIVLFVVLHIIVRASTEYCQSRQFEKFTEVIRGGECVWVSIYDIVVGDIVPLKIGARVPADGVLCVTNLLKIDEHEITGSHDIVQKDNEQDPFLLSGSELIEGIGTMLVTSVGMNTKCVIPHETDEEKPFQVYVKWIANSASWLIVLFASVACIVQLCRYFYGRTKKSDGNSMFIRGSTTADEATKFVIKFLSFGIATIIVGVPVGLYVAVFVNLANTKRKMMTDNALVQTLSACERMGSVTKILCHKTGILTLNQISVADVWAGGISMQDMDSGSQLPMLLKELIIEGIAQNTNGSVDLETGGTEQEFYGLPTEQAILSFGNKLGMTFDDAITGSASSVHHTMPFNRKKKYGGVAFKLSTEAHVHWKGSAKIILSSCKNYMDGADNPIAIDDRKRKDIEEAIKNMCKRGLRCAALAYQPYELEKLPTIEELSTLPSLPGNLVLLAIIGIEDPCRLTKEAIQQCKSAGVKVCMVTDDDVSTATDIAKKCGIFDDVSDRNIMTGTEFRNLSNLERKERAEDLLVLAESCPSDYLLFVEALKESGDVVATGMGIHDPETLLAADVSLAMGIGGTAAAKENSDIIILDDNFATVVKVIRWSRYLYTNIQRYVLFRLTVSVSLVAICVVEVVFYGAFPFNVVQLLLFNLIIDIFGALALTYRPTAHQLMRNPPVAIRDPLINKTMWCKLVLQVMYIVLFLSVINNDKVLELMHGPTSNVDKVKNTFIFTSFVFCLVFSEFEIESLERGFKEIFRDNMFLITIALTIVLQIIVLEFLVLFTSAARLDWTKWLLSSLDGLLGQFATHYPLQAFQYNCS